MNHKAMYKLSYGLYIVTTRDAEKINGCIVNTAIQAASTPNQICICINKANFKDAVAKKKASDEDLRKIIVNAYYVLMTRGMLGTFLYVCNPALKEYLSRYIPVI